MTPEGKVKSKVKQMFKAAAIPYHMPRGTVMGTSGIGDFVACAYGFYLEVECKAGKNKLTALQRQRRNEVIAGGGQYLVINEDNLSILQWTLNALKLKALINASNR